MEGEGHLVVHIQVAGVAATPPRLVPGTLRPTTTPGPAMATEEGEGVEKPCPCGQLCSALAGGSFFYSSCAVPCFRVMSAAKEVPPPCHLGVEGAPEFTMRDLFLATCASTGLKIVIGTLTTENVAFMDTKKKY